MSRSLNLLTNQAITTAGTVTGDPVAGIENMSHLTFQSSLDWGSGGSTIKVFLQTTLDRGTTWFDIACIAHTTADSIKALSVSGGASSAAPPTFTDGSLADDTVLDGFIGDQLRVKVISTGTYAATLLDVDVVAKSGVSDKASITPGTSATALGKAEDSPHTSGDVGIFALAVRNDSAAATFAGTDGDYSPIAVDSKGRAQVVAVAAVATADASSATAGFFADSGGSNRPIPAYGFSYNGTTFDRQRNNIDHGSVGITATGATTTQTGADQTNYNHRGAIIVLDMTSVGTGNVTLTVQAKDPVSGKYHTIFTGAAVSTNSTNVYTIYPGVTAVANAAVSFPLPRTWRVVVTANNANPTTYTVGATLIL